jgi:hypothetical protein
VTAAKANQYTRRNIETMEMLYGTGYLSMGVMTKLPISSRGLMSPGKMYSILVVGSAGR